MACWPFNIFHFRLARVCVIYLQVVRSCSFPSKKWQMSLPLKAKQLNFQGTPGLGWRLALTRGTLPRYLWHPCHHIFIVVYTKYIVLTPLHIGCGCGQCEAESYSQIDSKDRLAGFGKQIGKCEYFFILVFSLLQWTAHGQVGSVFIFMRKVWFPPILIFLLHSVSSFFELTVYQ